MTQQGFDDYLFAIYGYKNGIVKRFNPMEMTEIKWPSGSAGKQLPKPDKGI